jgi:hypothetical protein
MKCECGNNLFYADDSGNIYCCKCKKKYTYGIINNIKKWVLLTFKEFG